MSAIPDGIVRFTLYGECNLTRDTWNIVLHGSTGDGERPDTSDLNGLAEGVFNAFNSALWSASGTSSYFNDSSNLGGCNAYNLDNTNHVIDMGAYAPSDAIPGSHTGALPSECAIALTWLTGVPGRRGTGRSYLPGISTAPITADGVIATSATVALAAAGSAALTEMDVLSWGTLGVGPLSMGVLSVTHNAFNKINRVKVGNIVDVQRRRRNGAVEEYASAAVG